MPAAVRFLSLKAGISPELARGAVILGAVAFATPFIIGVLRIARAFGSLLAAGALPEAREGMTDLAAAPRRALVVTLQLAVVLLVGLPLLALTQPFLPFWVAAATLGIALLVLGFVFWRSATNLQGHVTAGAAMIAEALMMQARKPESSAEEEAFAEIEHLLPGMGEPVPLRLREGSLAIGKTLAQINLRGLTGASVLAIARSDQGVIVPTATEVLRAGDVLALAGTHESVDAAKRALRGE